MTASERAKLRRLIADYMESEGCSCCQNVDMHNAAKKALAMVLTVPAYQDGSGYDFSPFKTRPVKRDRSA